MSHTVVIPASVPKNKEQTYKDNYTALTHNTNRLFVFACDQKIEHLNKDFYGENIHKDAQDPAHLFEIAKHGRIGGMATHLGLIERYGNEYPDINYIIKLNAKTDLVKQEDPHSHLLWNIDDVEKFIKGSQLPIRGIGITVYPGSVHEGSMLKNAAQVVHNAHQHGLVAIIWMYPRGKKIVDEQDPDILAGAAGLAASLGADFVKIKPPHNIKDLPRICAAAGNTNIICSGGSQTDASLFLKTLHEQLHTGTTAGCATGRNVFQKSRAEAIAMTHAISDIVYDNHNADEAYTLYKKNKQSFFKE